MSKKVVKTTKRNTVKVGPVSVSVSKSGWKF